MFSNYGSTIGIYLKKRDIKYTDAAGKIGMNYQHFYRLVSGRRPCYAEDIQLLHDAGIIDAGRLFSGTLFSGDEV